MKARIIILLTLGVALVVASGAQATPILLHQSGSPGPWHGARGAWHDIYCEGPYWYAPPYNRYVVLSAQEIGRSPHPAYRNHFQDIFMQAQLQWSTDGANWNVYEKRNWQNVLRLRPGFNGMFAQETFDVTRWPGIMWRTVVEFRWYVAGTSTLLGTAIDGYSRSGIMTQYQVGVGTLSTGEGICVFP
jgi:hypothetical protein